MKTQEPFIRRKPQNPGGASGNYKDKMHVNDYTRQLMNEVDNPPIGLLSILMV